MSAIKAIGIFFVVLLLILQISTCSDKYDVVLMVVGLIIGGLIGTLAAVIKVLLMMPEICLRSVIHAAGVPRGGGGGTPAAQVPRLKVTRSRSQMTVNVPHSQAMTQTLRMHLPSLTSAAGARVQEPTLKVAMKLPQQQQMTLMVPHSQTLTQTFQVEE